MPLISRRPPEQGGHNGFGLHIAVVSLDCVDYRIAFLVLSGDINANLDVRAFHFVVHSLADIMEQAARRAIAGSIPSSLAIIPERKATSFEWFSTFWP